MFFDGFWYLLASRNADENLPLNQEFRLLDAKQCFEVLKSAGLASMGLWNNELGFLIKQNLLLLVANALRLMHFLQFLPWYCAKNRGETCSSHVLWTVHFLIVCQLGFDRFTNQGNQGEVWVFMGPVIQNIVVPCCTQEPNPKFVVTSRLSCT